MADKQSRLKQYDYKATSNLVLHTAERDRNIMNEPSGEAESLAGKLSGTRMGDRAVRARDKELEERLKKMKGKRSKLSYSLMFILKYIFDIIALNFIFS